MAVTNDDLRRFVRFAEETLENGGADSILQLASEWEANHCEKSPSFEHCEIQVDKETFNQLEKAFSNVQDEQQLQQALTRAGGVTTAEMLGKAILAASRAARG